MRHLENTESLRFLTFLKLKNEILQSYSGLKGNCQSEQLHQSKDALWHREPAEGERSLFTGKRSIVFEIQGHSCTCCQLTLHQNAFLIFQAKEC